MSGIGSQPLGSHSSNSTTHTHPPPDEIRSYSRLLLPFRLAVAFWRFGSRTISRDMRRFCGDDREWKRENTAPACLGRRGGKISTQSSNPIKPTTDVARLHCYRAQAGTSAQCLERRAPPCWVDFGRACCALSNTGEVIRRELRTPKAKNGKILTRERAGNVHIAWQRRRERLCVLDPLHGPGGIGNGSCNERLNDWQFLGGCTHVSRCGGRV